MDLFQKKRGYKSNPHCNVTKHNAALKVVRYWERNLRKKNNNVKVKPLPLIWTLVLFVEPAAVAAPVNFLS